MQVAFGVSRCRSHCCGGGASAANVADGRLVDGSAPALTSLVVTKPVKQVRFAVVAEYFDLFDDDFTFDNTNPDGTPKVRQQARERVGPPPRRESSVVK